MLQVGDQLGCRRLLNATLQSSEQVLVLGTTFCCLDALSTVFYLPLQHVQHTAEYR